MISFNELKTGDILFCFVRNPLVNPMTASITIPLALLSHDLSGGSYRATHPLLVAGKDYEMGEYHERPLKAVRSEKGGWKVLDKHIPSEQLFTDLTLDRVRRAYYPSVINSLPESDYYVFRCNHPEIVKKAAEVSELWSSPENSQKLRAELALAGIRNICHDSSFGPYAKARAEYYTAEAKQGRIPSDEKQICSQYVIAVFQAAIGLYAEEKHLTPEQTEKLWKEFTGLDSRSSTKKLFGYLKSSATWQTLGIMKDYTVPKREILVDHLTEEQAKFIVSHFDQVDSVKIIQRNLESIKHYASDCQGDFESFKQKVIETQSLEQFKQVG